MSVSCKDDPSTHEGFVTSEGNSYEGPPYLMHPEPSGIPSKSKAPAHRPPGAFLVPRPTHDLGTIDSQSVNKFVFTLFPIVLTIGLCRFDWCARPTDCPRECVVGYVGRERQVEHLELAIDWNGF
jgi:hypothetical protein